MSFDLKEPYRFNIFKRGVVSETSDACASASAAHLIGEQYCWDMHICKSGEIFWEPKGNLQILASFGIP